MFLFSIHMNWGSLKSLESEEALERLSCGRKWAVRANEHYPSFSIMNIFHYGPDGPVMRKINLYAISNC